MVDIELLKRLAEACDIERCADEEERDRNLNEFYSVLEPEDVATLIAENEALRSSSGFNELALLRMGFRQACEERDQLKAELERVRADAELLRKHLAECSDSLESEILDRYGPSKDHPAMRRKFECDMQDVIEARAAMGKGGAQNGTKTAETRASAGLEGGGHGSKGTGGHSAENQAEARVNPGSELAGKGGRADA